MTWRPATPLPPPVALALQAPGAVMFVCLHVRKLVSRLFLTCNCAFPPQTKGAAAAAVGGLDSSARVAWLAIGGAIHVWRCDGPAPSGHASVRLPAGTSPTAKAPLVATVLTTGRGRREQEDVLLVAALPDTAALVVWQSISPTSRTAPAQGVQYLPPGSQPTALIAHHTADRCVSSPRSGSQ